MTPALPRLTLLLAAALGSTHAATAQSPGLTLEGAVRLALGRHPSVTATAEAVAGASRGTREARAARLPQLRVDASATRFEEPMVVAPLHGIDPQSPPLFDETLVQVTVGLGYTLLDGGRRGAAVRREDATLALRSAEARAARQGVILDVTQAWLAVSAGREQVAAEDRRLEALRAEADRVRQFLAVGRAAPVEEVRVAAAVAEAEAGRAARAIELGRQVALLARLTGLAADEIENATFAPVRPAAPLPDTARALALVRSGSPDLARAAARIEVAETGIRAATSAWWPEVRLQGGYTDYSSSAGRLSGEWQAGVRAGYALFTGGARTAATARARHEHASAAAARSALELELATLAEQVLARGRVAAARGAALAVAVRRHEEVARIERLALDAGAGTQADWLAAEAAVLATRSALIEARHAEVLARLELARLAGELTAEAVPALVEVIP